MSSTEALIGCWSRLIETLMHNSIKLYYNELSHGGDKTNIKAFFDSVSYAAKVGCGGLVIPEKLTEGHSWKDCFNYGMNDRDEERRNKSYIDKSSTYHDLPQCCQIDSDKAVGISHAHRNGGIALSFAANGKWEARVVEVQCGDSSVEVKHISSIDHVRSHLDWILGRLQNSATKPQTMKECISACFRKLDLCKGTMSQLNKIAGGDLKKVVKVLFWLNAYCLDWDGRRFDKNEVAGIGGGMSRESESTMKHDRYCNERKLKCSDGKTRVFNWHAKPGGNLRVYFYPCQASGKIFIGHIGPHLSTAKH